MWLLTTRNRPEMCQRVLDACRYTYVTSPGLVWMDGCDYGELCLQDGWCATGADEHLNIGEILRRFFADYPDLPWYGWMSDDCIPLSLRWDQELISVAGRDGVAYPDDGWQRGRKERDGTEHVTSIVCLGGDFVRSLGGLALPGQVQMYIDDYWESVAVPSGLMRYCPHVKSEHLHFANGKRPIDGTDTRLFKGQYFPSRDFAIFCAWREGSGRAAAMQRASSLPNFVSDSTLTWEAPNADSNGT